MGVRDLPRRGAGRTRPQHHHRPPGGPRPVGAGRGPSWPATFGLACCAIEMMGAGGAHYDIARFGMEVFRASPRQADIMIVAGRVSQKMAPVLRQIYDQMAEPKWVISMGVCASTGGMFNNYAIVQGVDQIVPVDVYAPGCPPTPETLIHAITTLRKHIETGDILGAAGDDRRRRRPPRRGHPPDPAHHPQRRPVTMADRRQPAGAPDATPEPSDAASPPEPGPRPRVRDVGQRRAAVVHPTREQYLDLLRAAARRRLRPVPRRLRGRLPRPPGPDAPRGDRAGALRGGPAPHQPPTSGPDSASGSRCPRASRRCPRCSTLWPGTEAPERETYDMFGVEFSGPPGPDPHPDARGLGRPPAAQGLRRRRHPRAVLARSHGGPGGGG